MNFRLVSRETKLARTVADQDIQIRRRGGGGHPDPDPYRIRGSPVSKNLFLAPWASVWSKNKGGLGPLGPFPGSAATARKYLGEKISAH